MLLKNKNGFPIFDQNRKTAIQKDIFGADEQIRTAYLFITNGGEKLFVANNISHNSSKTQNMCEVRYK